ncbi:MAG TPA: hypothetical protein ENJ09_09830 [Planctomycetes bacterium]|nr:hypothetical protein [Planctomycetota bacterium]
MHLRFLAILLFAAPASANEIHVPANQPTIQQAVLAAVDGDTIVVHPGTYSEKLDLLGKALTLRSSDGADATFLQPPGGSPTLLIQSSVPLSGTVRLEGFTIQNAWPAVSLSGGTVEVVDNVFTNNQSTDIALSACQGISIRGNAFATGASDTTAIDLTNCTGEIALNTVTQHPKGCVFLSQASSVHVHHNVFKDSGNYGGWAPAIGLWTNAGSLTTVDHNLFLRNAGHAIDAGNSGAAIDADILSNRFVGNTNGAGGSVLACALNTGTLRFEGNFCEGPALTSGYVGEMIRADIGTITLRNNVFWHNQDVNSVLWTRTVDFIGSTVTLENCLFHTVEMAAGKWQAPLTIGTDSILWDLSIASLPWAGVGIDFQNTDVGPTPYGGSTTISVDPMFVDPAGGDFHLLAGSPCIDPLTSATTVTTDAEGRARDASPDYGPYEYTGHALWYLGAGEAGAAMKVVFQGQPGETVVLGYGKGLLPSPITTVFGDVWISGLRTTPVLGTIGSNGILEVPFVAPPWTTPRLYFTQALLGSTLTGVQQVLLGG